MERRTVILVEGDRGLEELVQTIIEQLDGAAVAVAESLARAKSMIRALEPALVIADEDISDASGQSLVQSLKADPETRDVPILVLCTDADTGRELVAAGAEAYLTKPFDVNDLLAVVQYYAGATPRRSQGR